MTDETSPVELRLQEVRQQYLDAVSKLVNDEPEKFRTLICHGVLGRQPSDSAEDQGLGIPFSAQEGDEVAARAASRYAYIADLLLRDQQGARSLPSSEFISIAQFVENNVHLDRWLGKVTFTSPRVMDIWHEYFQEFEASLSYSLALATHFIHQGVPPYQLNAGTGEYERLSDRDPLYQYLCLRGAAFDVVNDLNLPSWASTLFFQQDHLRWHQVFFASYVEPDPQKERDLRAALIKHLGLGPGDIRVGPASSKGAPTWPWGAHETVLLRHLAAAAERFWVNFDPSDIGTAPTNAEVVDWLRERGVAQRTAEVVATLLRADGLPTGPRP